MIYYGHQHITEKDIQAVERVLHSDWLTQGPAIEAFEKKVANYGPIHLGWSVRYKRRMSHKIDEMGNCWYVPGYGKTGSNLITGTFNIMFNI